MEPTFYEDVGTHPNSSKRWGNLTLNLNNPKPGSGITPLLETPDLFKLNTPEVEKLVLAQETSISTPSTTQIHFEVTGEQEEFGKVFENALHEFHNSDSSQEPSTSITYANLDSIQSSCSGADAQTVPSSVSSSPTMSPINMETQERIKLERKRQRNRIAASKCRKRKLERISVLEGKVNELKDENGELSLVVNRLKENVCRLKKQVMDHMHSGCQIMIMAERADFQF